MRFSRKGEGIDTEDGHALLRMGPWNGLAEGSSIVERVRAFCDIMERRSKMKIEDKDGGFRGSFRFQCIACELVGGGLLRGAQHVDNHRSLLKFGCMCDAQGQRRAIVRERAR